jgi:ABC-type amino acid transport substrate-binding protein
MWRNAALVVTFASALALLGARPALAGPADLAVHVTRLGGDPATAQPYLDKFLAWVRDNGAWPAGARAQFLPARKDLVGFLDEAKPGFAMLEPALVLELGATHELVVLARIDSKDLVSPRLHVVVRDPAFKTLADLAGKRLWTQLADAPRYLSKVVLDAQVDAATHFALKPIAAALKGVRGVLRGEADATILDDEQLAEARKMQGGAELRTVHTSPALPPVALVAFAAHAAAADRTRLVTTLAGMCATPAGGAVCKELRIGAIVPADATLFADARKRFDKP